VRAAAEALGGVETRPPGVSEATDLFFALMAADGGAQARADTEAVDRHVPQFARLLETIRPLALDASALLVLFRRLYAFRASVRAFVGAYDAVLCPVTTGPAPPHGCAPGRETPLESYLSFNYTHTYSLAGLPVVVVRVGEERGLPLGVQVVAPAFRDDVALAVAAALERMR
jgi:amidase